MYKCISFSTFLLKNVNRYTKVSFVNLPLQITKSFHRGSVCFSIEKSLLSKLRKKTGFAISQCKKALEMHNSDIDQAEEWLLKEAQAQGWAKATKLSGRATKQGLIGIHIEGNIGGMVEVNCETDFVARNTDFQALVQTIAKEFTLHSSTNSPTTVPAVLKETVEKETLEELKTKEGNTLSDLVALTIGKIGENIQLSRAIKFTCPKDLQLVGYAHPPPPSSSSYLYGKYCALIAFKNASNDDLIKELSAHIVGMNPLTIGTYEPDNSPENDSKEHSTNSKETTISSSEDSVSSMDENEEENENENVQVKEKQTVLVYQDFLSSPEYTVGEILQENNVEIVDFVRVECGETQCL